MSEEVSETPSPQAVEDITPEPLIQPIEEDKELLGADDGSV